MLPHEGLTAGQDERVDPDGHPPVPEKDDAGDVHDLAELRALEDQPDESSPEDRQRRLLILAALLTLLVVCGGLAGFLALASNRTRTAAAPAASTATATPTPTPTPAAATVTPVNLGPADYVGRPVADVQARLTAQQLLVSLRPLQTSAIADGSVISLDRVGAVLPGTTVTVTYAVAPPRAPAPPPRPTHRSTPTPTQKHAPRPTPAAPSTPAPTPDVPVPTVPPPSGTFGVPGNAVQAWVEQNWGHRTAGSSRTPGG
jgi:serine/threonine-protein kinase